MANLNKVMLIGRLTREPAITEHEDGGRVANVGFVVHNRRKNAESGQWEDVPVWLGLKAFNRPQGRQLADLAAKLHKGRQVYVEGHLALEKWTGKEDGKHHSRTLVYVETIEFLDSAAQHPAADQSGEQERIQPAEKADPRPAGAESAQPAGHAGPAGQAGPAPAEASQQEAAQQPAKPARARRKNAK